MQLSNHPYVPYKRQSGEAVTFITGDTIKREKSSPSFEIYLQSTYHVMWRHTSKARGEGGRDARNEYGSSAEPGTKEPLSSPNRDQPSEDSSAASLTQNGTRQTGALYTKLSSQRANLAWCPSDTVSISYLPHS